MNPQNNYKFHLEQYLRYKGFEIDQSGMIRCINYMNHSNQDNKKSAKVYNNSKGQRMKCFACGYDGDIYDVIGEIEGIRNFKEQYEFINNLFGGGYVEPMKKQAKKKIEFNPVAIEQDDVNKIYSRSAIDENRSFSKQEVLKNGELVKAWKYTDKDNKIIAVDCRFEMSGEKTVCTYWYNGKRILSSGTFSIIYNLYESLNTDKPIIIHEGAKCAQIGNDDLYDFCSVAYNRGSNNADKVDWSVLKDKQGYILPDNDLPGFKAAYEIKKQLPHFKILSRIYKHFNCDVKGFDIEDLFEFCSKCKSEINNYILDYEESIFEESIIKLMEK